MKHLKQREPGTPLKKGRRFISVLIALIVVIALFSMNSAVFAGPAGGNTSDLANILTGVSVTDFSGNLDSGPYVLGSDYVINLSFQEDAYQLMPNAKGALTYQLPQEIEITKDIENEPIYAAAPNDQKELGAYSVDKNGLVTVTLHKVFLDGSPAPLPFYENYLNTFFKLNISARFSGDIGDTNIEFSNTVTMPVTITDKITQAALDLTKKVSYDPAKLKLAYTAVLTATKGAVSDITYQDDGVIGGNSHFYSYTKKNFIDSINVSINGGAPVTYKEVNPNAGAAGTYYWVNAADGAGGFYLNFPEGTTLDEGQSIKVTYVIDARTMIADSGRNPYLATDMEITNTAYASGKDGAGKPLKAKALADARVTTRPYFTKTGKATGDTITWEATVGDGVEPLTGKAIYDNLNASSGGTQAFHNTQVTIRLYAADHTTLLKADEITAASGTEFTYEVATPGAYYADISYVISGIDRNVASYSNGIGISVGGSNYGTSVSTGNPGAKMTGNKTGVVTTDSRGRAVARWTIVWTIPAGYYGHSAYLKDVFVYGGSGFQNIPTNVHVTATVGSETMTLKPDDPEYGWKAFTCSDGPGANLNDHQTNWYFMFAPNGALPDKLVSGYGAIPGGQHSLSPFRADATVTITYDSLLDDLTYVTPHSCNDSYVKEGDTLRTALDHPAGIANQVWWYGTLDNDTWTSGYDFTTVYSPIYKSAIPGGDGKYIDYTVSLNKPNGNTNFELGDDPVFTDTFNSDLLEYVPDTFYVNSGGAQQNFGPYDASGKDLLSGCITKNKDGTSTITVPLKDLKAITGPAPKSGGAATNYSNINVPAWTGPPASVSDASGKWWVLPATRGNGIVQVFYRLQLKPDAEPGIHDIYNRATINAHWTAGNTATLGHGVVTKHMTKDDAAGNTVDVAIDINPDGLILAPRSANGLYEVTDTMSSSLTAFLSSLEARYQDTPGGAWQNAALNNDYGTAWSYQFSAANNTIKFIFPDRTPIKLSYSARVAGKVGDTVADVSNAVTVASHYSDSANMHFVVTKTGASIGGSYLPVTLFKRDAENKEAGLPGARFALYMDKAYPNLPAVPGGINATKIIGGKTFYYVDHGSTGENGRLVFDNQFLNNSTGAVYAVTELKAPEGYGLPKNPDTLFALQNQDFSAFGPLPVTVISDYLNVYNEKAAQQERNTAASAESTKPNAGPNDSNQAAATGNGNKTPAGGGTSSVAVSTATQTGDHANYLLYVTIAAAASLAAALILLLPAMRKRRNN